MEDIKTRNGRYMMEEKQFTYTALLAPGTWYFICNLANQYLAWVFELSASKASSKFSLAV